MKKRTADLPAIDLIPLLDALFCTLFFYMAFAFFASSPPAKELPVKKTVQSKTSVKKAAHVWVKEGGDVFVNGSPMQKAQVVSFFTKKKNQFMFVSVGGDGNARVDDIQTVIHWLKSSGVTKISFRAK